MDAFGLAGNVEALATHTITRRRSTPAPMVNGRPSGDPTVVDTPMRAVVYPLPGTEAVRLALGERAKDAKTAIVASEDLLVSDDLVIDGAVHSIVAPDDWRASSGCTRAVCIRRAE